MQCGEWHDEMFEQAADRLGEPVSTLVALSDEDGHPAGLVEVIVSVALLHNSVAQALLLKTSMQVSR